MVDLDVNVKALIKTVALDEGGENRLCFPLESSFRK